MNLKNKLLSSSRITKQFLVALTDLVSFSFAVILACLVSNLDLSSISSSEVLRIIWIPFFSVFVFYSFGVYRSVLRYIDFALINLLFKASIVAFLLNLILRFFYANYLDFIISHNNFKNLINIEGLITGFLCSLVLVVASRVYANFLLSAHKSEKKVVIYGAGSAGIQLSEALKVSSEMQPVAFFDSNPLLENTFLGGIKILNPNKLQSFIRRNRIDEVLIAMPSASKSTLSNLLKEIESLSIKVRILPGLAALAQGEVSVSELKEVDISDLLGRQEVEASKSLLSRNITGKIVLITGAGGSIGSEICRQVSKNSPREIIMLDSNEYALYSIKSEIERQSKDIKIHSILGSITDRRRMTEVHDAFEINTVYHAAAYKHVPLVEENPIAGIVNNSFSTLNICKAASKCNLKNMLLIKLVEN